MTQSEFRMTSTSRRTLIGKVGALVAGLRSTQNPAYAQTNATPGELSGNTIDLTIAESHFSVDGKVGKAVTVNGTVPGPLIRLREGQDVTLRVTNRLKEPSSIHWHGILLPPEMDGVPGVSFAGIPPGATFIYRFPVKQSGTYWYHSHSGHQEQEGMYAPMIIEPAAPDPVKYDREYAVVLSNWSFGSGKAMIANLKKKGGYFNFQQRTAREFFADIKRDGWKPTLDNYLMWSRMRMDPTDFADVTSHAFVHLINGAASNSNWTGLFRPGQRVRLRFINAASMSIYDVRVPGLKMTVVQADGQNVQPVEVEEFRISAAETYDVIVQPTDDRAYTIFAETNDRSGYTRATLAPRAGMSAEIPTRRPRPLRTMDDMGMNMQAMNMEAASGEKKMAGMDHGSKSNEKEMPADHANMPGMPPVLPKKQPAMGEMPGMGKADRTTSPIPSDIPGRIPVPHGPGSHGTTNQTVPEVTRSRLHEPGTGLGSDGSECCATPI